MQSGKLRRVAAAAAFSHARLHYGCLRATQSLGLRGTAAVIITLACSVAARMHHSRELHGMAAAAFDHARLQNGCSRVQG